jgi:hypothetical protein
VVTTARAYAGPALGRTQAPRLLFAIDIRDLLAAMIPDDEASGRSLDRPGRREAARRCHTLQDRYRERSPLYHADQLSKPVSSFRERRTLSCRQIKLRPCEALRRKGKAVGYFLFSGEQHGFRRAANIKRCLDAQLQFYAEAFLIGLTF